MYPIIHIENIDISSYYLMMLVGFLAMGCVTLHRKKYYNMTTIQAWLFTTMVMVAGLIGCKLLFVLEGWPDTLKNGIISGGFSFFGAVFFVPIIMFICKRLFHLNTTQTFDATALCGVTMVGSIRFGCFLNGCCGGLCVTINEMSFCWPTQAAESIGDFLILFYLLSLQEKESRAGELYPIFMFLYGTMRFAIEFFRDTPKDWLYLSHGQWFSILAVAIGGGLMCWNRNRKVAGDQYEKKT